MTTQPTPDRYDVADCTSKTDPRRMATIRDVVTANILTVTTEDEARNLIAKLTAWLDAPRLAARKTPTVVASDAGVELLRTASGEWASVEYPADHTTAHADTTLTWYAGAAAEGNARSDYANARGKALCICGAECAEDEIDRLFNAECPEFGAVNAPIEWPPVDRPAPTLAVAPGLDLDAVADTMRGLDNIFAQAMSSRDAEIARLTAELAAARAVTAGVCRYLDCSESDLLAVVTSLYESRARAISDATAARGTVGGLLATAPECPTWCATHDPRDMATAMDGDRRYASPECRDAGRCLTRGPLPKGG